MYERIKIYLIKTNMFKKSEINIADLAKYLWLPKQFLYQIDKGERQLPKKYRPLVRDYIQIKARLLLELDEIMKES